MRWAVLIVIAGSLIFGCSQKTEEERAGKAPEMVTSAAEAVSSLPVSSAILIRGFHLLRRKEYFRIRYTQKQGIIAISAMILKVINI